MFSVSAPYAVLPKTATAALNANQFSSVQYRTTPIEEDAVWFGARRGEPKPDYSGLTGKLRYVKDKALSIVKTLVNAFTSLPGINWVLKKVGLIKPKDNE
jgi:hypothetical protein